MDDITEPVLGARKRGDRLDADKPVEHMQAVIGRGVSRSTWLVEARGFRVSQFDLKAQVRAHANNP